MQMRRFIQDFLVQEHGGIIRSTKDMPMQAPRANFQVQGTILHVSYTEATLSWTTYYSIITRTEALF